MASSCRGFVLLATVLTLFFTGSHGCYQVKLQTSKNNPHVNEDVTFTCQVTSTTTELPVITWLKHTDAGETQIAVSKYIMGSFQGKGRYTAGYVYDEGTNEIMFTLHIRNLQVGDSGWVGCRTFGAEDNRAEAFKQLKVML